MLLTQTAEYAFRSMACLAGLEAGASLKSAQISEVTGIPVHFLAKVMRRLVVAGLVSSQKGHGGGFSLAKPASQIRFADIMEAVGIESDDHCAFGWARCNRTNPCPMHPAWAELKERCRAWAEEHHLADIKPQHVDPAGLPEIPAKRSLKVLPPSGTRGRRPRSVG